MVRPGGPHLSALLWLAAVAPVLLLFALIAVGRVSSRRAAGAVLLATVVLAATVFRAGIPTLSVGLAKGAWLGLWILLVVWPALLLYRVAAVAGLDGIGRFFSSVLPRRRENLLVVAWLFPGFVQGVAGFGTPIAVSAPLLVAMGWTPTQAVLYPLIGYHWAVTFGSMGSSYYMASFTAGLEPADATAFAVTAAGLLAVNAVLGGAVVLWLDGRGQGLREGGRTLLGVGLPMGVVLVVTAGIVPAVASLAAGAAGLSIVAARSAWRRRAAPRPRRVAGTQNPPAPCSGDEDGSPVHPVLALAPYLYLLATALPLFVIPATRDWISSHLVVAPGFPRTETGRGVVAPAVVDYTPVEVLGHPGFYIGCACVLGYLTYRATGVWGDASGRGLIRAWARSLPRTSVPIVLLAAVATVLVDSGMVAVLARGVAAVAGPAYPVVSPAVGALGSFMTGSTTTSNALFAALQVDVAGLLDLPPAVLLAAQTAGGNVGNIIAPVVVLVGLSALDAGDRLSGIVRAAAWPVAGLLAWLAVATGLLALL